MYKSFEFLAGLFFLFSSMNFLLLGVVHDHFHQIRRKFNKNYFKKKKKKTKSEKGKEEEETTEKLEEEEYNVSTSFYKFKYLFYIKRDEKEDIVFLTNIKSKKIMGLFGKL